jgi:hypothetical protein
MLRRSSSRQAVNAGSGEHVDPVKLEQLRQIEAEEREQLQLFAEQLARKD